MWEDNNGNTFWLEEVLLCIRLNFGNMRWLKYLDRFASYKCTPFYFTTLIAGLEWCGLLWCFYQLFGLSFWRHPFTAEDPLVNTWCNAKFLQICSNEETNSSTSQMAWGWVHFQQILGWTIPLKDSQKLHISRYKHIEERKSDRFRTWRWANKTVFIFGSTIPLRKTWEMRHLRQMNRDIYCVCVCVCVCRTTGALLWGGSLLGPLMCLIIAYYQQPLGAPLAEQHLAGPV